MCGRDVIVGLTMPGRKKIFMEPSGPADPSEKPPPRWAVSSDHQGGMRVRTLTKEEHPRDDEDLWWAHVAYCIKARREKGKPATKRLSVPAQKSLPRD